MGLGNLQELCYQGHAFYAGFNKGKASGEIHVSQNKIVFTHPEHQASFSINDAKITLGGASNRLVFIKHISQPEWTFFTADRSILQNPFLKLDVNVNAQMGKAKWLRKLNWFVAFSVLVLFVLLPVSTFVFMDSLTKVMAKQVPTEWEQKLGETAYAQYGLGHDVLKTERSQVLLEELTQPLLNVVSEPKPKFTLYIVNDPAINAFALPGGIIVINTGLILAANSADEVLGVLAHEIIHVTEQHGIRNIMSTAGTYLIVQAMIGDASGVLATLASAAPLLIGQQYSRNFESEADEFGFELLHKANINPQGLADFFVILEADKQQKKLAQKQLAQKQLEAKNKELNQEDSQDSEQDKATDEAGLSQEKIEAELEPWLSSHPATQDRIVTLNKKLQGLEQQKYINLSSSFTELKALVEVFVAQGADNTLENNDEI